MSSGTKLALRALLLTLVFTMQGLCNAHQVDHFVSGDDVTCSICSAGGQIDDAILGEYRALPDSPTDTSIASFPLLAIALRFEGAAVARSPPLSC